MTTDATSPRRGRLRRLTGGLRFRITALATIAVLVILVVAAVLLIANQRRQLTDAVDDALEQQARTLVPAVESGNVPEDLPSFDGEDYAARVTTEDGDVVAASEDDVEDDDGIRRFAGEVSTPDGERTIEVWTSLEDVEESAAALRRSLMVAIPVVIVLLAALIWWLVGRTLRPVEAIRATVGEIGGHDLTRRVPVPRSEDEIARLARTMNEMLDRLEESHRRQEQFVADAAHELRTPLARMRSELEVDAAHPEVTDAAALRQSALDETVALQRMVEDLLQLARSDGGVGARPAVAVDLDDIVLRQARRMREEARVTVDASAVSAAQVFGDPDQLARAIRNLTDNAQRHAASRVELSLVEDGPVARLTVADDGPGIPLAAREAVFGRFTRLDEARVADGGGAGLGLAITREIVEAHGGTVELADGPGPGARFVVALPRHEPAPG
jgi:signal transduction histidine kinase